MYLLKTKAQVKNKRLFIQASGGLSEAEIDQMVKDAEANKEADEKIKEKIEARNHDGLVASTEKALKEHGDKVSAEEKTKVETSINDLKEALKGDDTEDIKKKTGELDRSVNETWRGNL